MSIPTLPQRTRGLTFLLALLFALPLAGCGSRLVLPPADISAARAAVATAEEAGAGEHAPLALRTAQQKLEQAQQAADRGDNTQARILSEQAAVDARLAEIRSRATRQEAALQTVQRSIDTLREEIDRSRRTSGDQ